MQRNSLIRPIFMQAAQTFEKKKTQTNQETPKPRKRSSRQHLQGSAAGMLIEVAAHLILIDQADAVGTIHMNKRNNRIAQVPRKVESISDASGAPAVGADNGNRCLQTDEPRAAATGSAS